MGLDVKLENGVQLHWATPIFTRKFDDTEELNARLAEIILERERQEPGVPKSVVHGWHSKEDFFEWPHPEVAPVRDFVRRAMIELTSATTGHKEGEFGGEAEFIAWATILRKGGYNSVHTHPGCAWSGVYYVDTGGAAAATAASSSSTRAPRWKWCLCRANPSANAGGSSRKPGVCMRFPPGWDTA